MYEWSWKFFFSSFVAQDYRHLGLISALQAAGLICIVWLFVLGLWRGRRWMSEPIFPEENLLPDMWLARCGVWVAVVAFLLGWIPQMSWLHRNLETGLYMERSEVLMFDAFGNLYVGLIVLTAGFAQYFILHFVLSGIAIERASAEAIPVANPPEHVEKNADEELSE